MTTTDMHPTTRSHLVALKAVFEKAVRDGVPANIITAAINNAFTSDAYLCARCEDATAWDDTLVYYKSGRELLCSSCVEELLDNGWRLANPALVADEINRIWRLDAEDRDGRKEELRWARAASWARGQSFGPYVHGLSAEERERIEAIAKRIDQVGEDQGRSR